MVYPFDMYVTFLSPFLIVQLHIYIHTHTHIYIYKSSIFQNFSKIMFCQHL